jgi:hypothetical protein
MFIPDPRYGTEFFSIPDPGVKKAEKTQDPRIRNTDTWAEPEMLRMADVLCDSSAMLPLQLLVIEKYHNRILYGTPMDWCLIECMGWRYRQSCWYFRPLL